jgi:hypothetical protein
MHHNLRTLFAATCIVLFAQATVAAETPHAYVPKCCNSNPSCGDPPSHRNRRDRVSESCALLPAVVTGDFRWMPKQGRRLSTLRQ